MRALKVTVFDYPSANGALRRQRQIMLRALRADLAQLPGVTLVVLKTAAAAAAGVGAERAIRIGAGAAGDDARVGSGIEADKPAAIDADLAAAVDAAIHAADAVWPMAPDAGGVLERVSQQVLNNGRILLGSRPQALRVAGSRLRTARVLAQAGIPVAAIYAVHQALPRATGAWLVRPDDGDGSADTRIYASAAGARAWILAQQGALRGPPPPTSGNGAATGAPAAGGVGDGVGVGGAVDYVLQPFIPGKAGSLSLLCCDGRAQLLSCNEHRIAVRDNQLHFLGTTVNSMADSDGAFARLAQAVAAAVPGLWGHVGVEFVIGVRGVVVLGVNTRITPAYAGLRASLGCNPAALVMDLLEHPVRTRPTAAAARPAAVAVSVDLGFDPGVDPGIYPDIDRGDRQR